jgi:hypothetical protein
LRRPMLLLGALWVRGRTRRYRECSLVRRLGLISRIVLRMLQVALPEQLVRALRFLLPMGARPNFGERIPKMVGCVLAAVCRARRLRL